MLLVVVVARCCVTAAGMMLLALVTVGMLLLLCDWWCGADYWSHDESKCDLVESMKDLWRFNKSCAPVNTHITTLTAPPTRNHMLHSWDKCFH